MAGPAYMSVFDGKKTGNRKKVHWTIGAMPSTWCSKRKRIVVVSELYKSERVNTHLLCGLSDTNVDDGPSDPLRKIYSYINSGAVMVVVLSRPHHLIICSSSSKPQTKTIYPIWVKRRRGHEIRGNGKQINKR